MSQNFADALAAVKGGQGVKSAAREFGVSSVKLRAAAQRA